MKPPGDCALQATTWFGVPISSQVLVIGMFEFFLVSG